MRREKINNWGTTEEYEARLDKRMNPQAPKGTKQRRAAALAPSVPCLKCKALYKQCQYMNDTDPTAEHDPWQVDHIRSPHIGGLTVRENLRIIRRSQNIREGIRTEEEITKLLAANHKLIWGY